MDTLVSIPPRTYAATFDRTVTRRCFATGAIRDDANGAPIGSGAALIVDDPQLLGCLGTSAYAVIGDPDVALRDASIPHPLTLMITRGGYRPAMIALTVPAFPSGPVVQDIALRRLPVPLRGRVLGRNGAIPPEFLPVADARIDVTGPIGPGGEIPLLLGRPLGRDLGAGATLRARGLSALADVSATIGASTGDDGVILVDGTGVAAGQLLRFGTSARGHWTEIAAVAPDPDRPAPAAIAWTTERLGGSVVAGEPIRRFTKNALTGPTATPAGQAYGGESILWVDALPVGGDVLVLREAGHPDAYFDHGVTSGLAGDYAIDGFARMGSASITVSAAGFVPQTRDFSAAGLAGEQLDWRLVP